MGLTVDLTFNVGTSVFIGRGTLGTFLQRCSGVYGVRGFRDLVQGYRCSGVEGCGVERFWSWIEGISG